MNLAVDINILVGFDKTISPQGPLVAVSALLLS